MPQLPAGASLALSSGQWDFDGDEGLVLIVSGIATLIFGFVWYRPLVQAIGGTPPLRTPVNRKAVGLLPPLALLSLFICLRLWADPVYVADQLDYLLLFVLVGVVWLFACTAISRLMGVGLLDDVLSRNNPAAMPAVAGAVLGGMAIYAGCNVGAGPTIWTTLVPAFVATAAWAGLWLIVEAFSGVSEAIAIDRDRAAGVRQGGYLLASGLVLGRAMAGDWTSWSATYEDFIRLGWPAVLWSAGVTVLHWVLRPTPHVPQRPVLSAGIAPAMVMVAMAIIYLLMLGPASIGQTVITYEQYMGE